MIWMVRWLDDATEEVDGDVIRHFTAILNRLSDVRLS